MNANSASRYRALSTRLLSEKLDPQVRQLAQGRVSLSELARRVGYGSPSGLLAAMTGKTQPPLHVLVGLAAELGLHSIEELFGDFGTSPALAGPSEE